MPINALFAVANEDDSQNIKRVAAKNSKHLTAKQENPEHEAKQERGNKKWRIRREDHFSGANHTTLNMTKKTPKDKPSIGEPPQEDKDRSPAKRRIPKADLKIRNAIKNRMP